VEGDSRLDRCLITVGDCHEILSAKVARLAAGHDVERVSCEDIYSAVAELAGRRDRCVLVVGPLRELASEKGVFFGLAARNAARCVCVSPADRPLDCEEVVTAVRAGASVVSRAEDLFDLIEDWLAGGGCVTDPRGGRRTVDDNLRATEAELDALLGQEEW
jgi:hypothetical protein